MSGKLLRYGLLMIILIFGGCVDPIDLDIEREGFQLVVFGHIDTSTGPFYVQLQRTSELPFRYIPENGARITLHDDLGNEGRFFNAQGDGIYRYNTFSMQLSAGRSYFVRIRTVSGELYESVPEQIPLNRATSEVSVNFETIEINTGSAASVISSNVVQVSAATTFENPAAQYFIRYTPIQTFRFDVTNFPDPFNSVPPPCFVNRRMDPERLPLFNSGDFGSPQIPFILVGQNVYDYAWITKNVISVETHSISREAYEYWRKIRILLNNNGSVFDTPPAAVQGNIFNVNNPDEQVLGYFEASNVHVARTTKWFVETPWRRPDDPCKYEPNKDRETYPRECLNCTILPGAQFQEPIFY